jgi:hypothetical protein
MVQEDANSADFGVHSLIFMDRENIRTIRKTCANDVLLGLLMD